jgi:uroporphyrinogen decarboxylase
MFSRRQFFFSATAAVVGRAATTALKPRERVDRALAGKDVDRPPFTYWYHFLDEKQPGEKHAENTLNFHRKFRTDVVKVMSDYPYPKPAGEWFALKVEQNPFPQQIRALQLIRDGLAGQVHFIETIFNPWKVAEKLSSADEVKRMKAEKPQRLLDALEVIAKSEANHARKAIAAGASGIFLAIDNHDADYAKFSEPFDKIVLDAVKSAPMNTLHLHGDKIPMERFYQGWSASILNYSAHATGINFVDVRRGYSGVIMGGIDEKNYRTLAHGRLKTQWITSMRGAEPKYILSPGCSVPNDTTDTELLLVTKMFGA